MIVNRQRALKNYRELYIKKIRLANLIQYGRISDIVVSLHLIPRLQKEKIKIISNAAISCFLYKKRYSKKSFTAMSSMKAIKKDIMNHIGLRKMLLK